MNISTVRLFLFASVLCGVPAAYAVDLTINGFISVGGGMTLNEGSHRQQNAINPDVPQGTETQNTYVADPVSNGVYGDSWSFRPDTNYGLQITGDLGEGLKVTSQITGSGGEDFVADISWAYISYQFDERWSAMLGRQRLPLFYYSDFIDVGYAYHWIRPPQELVASEGNTIEGVKFRYQSSIKRWDYSAEVYYGGGHADVGEDKIAIDTKNQQGIVLKASNDWLTFRATWSKADSIVDSPLATLTNQGTSENPLVYTFIGFATEMRFENDVFVVAEYTQGRPNNPSFPSIPVGGPAVMEVNGGDKSVGWYVTSGIRLGQFTPHLTYSNKTTDYDTPFAQYQQQAAVIAAGVRWDFHTSAALKFEYITRSDKSDDYYKNQAGAAGVPGVAFAPGVGYGSPADIDLIAVSLDLVF